VALVFDLVLALLVPVVCVLDVALVFDLVLALLVPVVCVFVLMLKNKLNVRV